MTSPSEYTPIECFPIERECSVDGCTTKHLAKGYCQKHYMRFWKHGDPSISKSLHEGTAWERVEQRIEKVDTGFYQPCWEFTGSLVRGYGHMTYDSKNYLTHRISYEHHNGPIPEGMEVDHICCNRKCCNPDHLDAVTHEENKALGGTPHFLPRFRSAEEDAANCFPRTVQRNDEVA